MRIILHIGAGKCGSSAIQRYLTRNAPALRQNGVLVPDKEMGITGNVTGEQTWLFQEAMTAPAPSALNGPKFAALRKQMAANNLHTAVLSAENLMNEAAFAPACAPAAEIFDQLQIVSYIRRQDDYLISAWCQWWFKVHASIGDYIRTPRQHSAHWARIIRRWEDVFGTERINVRLYQHGTLVNNDIVDDFIEATGIPRDGCVPNIQKHNVSMNEILIEIAHDIREVFSSVHDVDFMRLASSILREDAQKSYRGSTLLSLAERQDIMSYYDDCNREIKQKYFANIPQNQSLFKEPSAEDVMILSPEQRAQMRELLMLQLLKGLTRLAQEKRQQAEVH